MVVVETFQVQPTRCPILYSSIQGLLKGDKNLNFFVLCWDSNSHEIDYGSLDIFSQYVPGNGGPIPTTQIV